MQKNWDVIIAGGGSAGLAAALASARLGAKTLLFDRQTMLGGMGVNALVHTFCGLFHPDTALPWAWLNAGIPQEVGEAMMKATGQTQPELMGRVYVLRQHPSLFAGIADKLCREQERLTRCSGVEWAGLEQMDSGWRVRLVSRGEGITLETKALVDTTGDATGARNWLKRDFWAQTENASLYRPAFICGFSGVIGQHDDAWRLSMGALIVRAVRDGALPSEALGAQFRDSPLPGEMYLTLDLEGGFGAWDPFDPVRRAAVEAQGRAVVLSLWEFLKVNHPDFSFAGPPSFPTQLGIRESARYVGDVVLNGVDLATNRRFSDEVALAGWPMEKRENARGPKLRYFDKAQPAGIPVGCLRRRELPGLFFAGRCLSVDHEALASVRVMGTCMATGQAAGRLACEHVETFG